MRLMTLLSACGHAFRRASPCVLVSLFAFGSALAQTSSPFGTSAPNGSQPAPQPAVPQRQAASNPAAPAPGADAQVIARVEGRAITQAQFDRIAGPYFVRMRAQLGDNFKGEILKSARQAVLDELIRREVLALEAQRQKLAATDDEVDALLHQEPAFQTDGHFDPSKLAEFKLSPQSNYRLMLPQLREFAASMKLDQQLRERFTPSRAELRAEFEKRYAQVRFHFLALQRRDMPLEPESSEAEWQAYYDAHPAEFTKHAQLRLRYRRLALPPAGDSTRVAAESLAVARGRQLADSLRAGTLADSSAETLDTGLFDASAPLVPGLGRVPELSAAIAHADSLPSLRVLGPFRLADAVIVASIAERQPKQLPPLRAVLGDVKRRADAEKRRLAAEADRRAYYDAHRDHYRGTRASVTRLTLKMASYKARAIPDAEVARWYQTHGHTLYGLADSSRAWLPPLTDSLRRVADRRMAEDERDRWIASTMEKLATGLGATRDVAAFARANGAAAETLSFAPGTPADTLFPPAIIDAIRANAVAQRGQVQGPSAFGAYSTVWRVDAVDTAYVPTFELARGRVEPEFAEQNRLKDEQEGHVWFDAHRTEYVKPVQYVVDYVLVPIPPADSVRLSEAELKAEYQRNLARYHQEEQVHARHLLIIPRAGDAGAEAKAKARTDSLLAAIRHGADFVELARRFSQEPNAATSGGDLGWFGRGRMVPDFERAAFALKAGEVSPVVKTQFGYHIIRLEARKAAGTRPFAETRDEIRSALAAALADTSARRGALALRRGLALAKDAKPLAARYGGVQTTAPFAASEPAGSLGIVAGLSDDLAKLAVGHWAARTYRAGRGFVLLRPVRTLPERPAEFDEVKAKAIEDTKDAKRKDLLDRKVTAIRTALAAGATLDSLAAPYGGTKDSGPLTPGYPFVPGLGPEMRLVQQAFAAKVGVLSDTLQLTQGVAWFRVDEHNSGDPKGFEAAQTQLTQELMKKNYDQWLDKKKQALRIEVLKPELGVARVAPPKPGVTAGG